MERMFFNYIITLGKSAIDLDRRNTSFSCSLEAWGLLDSQNFLVRQRRNRVYAVLSTNSGQDESTFSKEYRRAIDSLQTHCHFSMKQSFGNYSREDPRTTREAQLIEMALTKAKEDTCLQQIYSRIHF